MGDDIFPAANLGFLQRNAVSDDKKGKKPQWFLWDTLWKPSE